LCFSSSFLRLFNPGGSGHVQGALAHRAQRGLPLTWPRQDYIALLEEEEKRRSNRPPPAAARGRPPPWCPAAMAGGQGKEHAPAPGARQHPARPVKDQSTYSGAQRPTRGVGARCPHAVRPRPPAPRPARAVPATEGRQHRCPPGCPDVHLRETCDITRHRGAGLAWCASHARSERQSPLTRGIGGDRNKSHGQSVAAPVPSLCAPWGAARGDKAQRPFERVAEPPRGRNVA
jgi:hypothetical protein